MGAVCDYFGYSVNFSAEFETSGTLHVSQQIKHCFW